MISQRSTGGGSSGIIFDGGDLPFPAAFQQDAVMIFAGGLGSRFENINVTRSMFIVEDNSASVALRVYARNRQIRVSFAGGATISDTDDWGLNGTGDDGLPFMWAMFYDHSEGQVHITACYIDGGGEVAVLTDQVARNLSAVTLAASSGREWGWGSLNDGTQFPNFTAAMTIYNPPSDLVASEVEAKVIELFTAADPAAMYYVDEWGGAAARVLDSGHGITSDQQSSSGTPKKNGDTYTYLNAPTCLAENAITLGPNPVTYSTGTIGIASGVVTLTGGTFPEWAPDGNIVVGGSTYSVNTRNSGTELTLNNLTVNVSGGTAYELTDGPLVAPTVTGDWFMGVNPYSDSIMGGHWNNPGLGTLANAERAARAPTLKALVEGADDPISINLVGQSFVALQQCAYIAARSNKLMASGWGACMAEKMLADSRFGGYATNPGGLHGGSTTFRALYGNRPVFRTTGVDADGNGTFLAASRGFNRFGLMGSGGATRNCPLGGGDVVMLEGVEHHAQYAEAVGDLSGASASLGVGLLKFPGAGTADLTPQQKPDFGGDPIGATTDGDTEGVALDTTEATAASPTYTFATAVWRVNNQADPGFGWRLDKDFPSTNSFGDQISIDITEFDIDPTTLTMEADVAAVIADLPAPGSAPAWPALNHSTSLRRWVMTVEFTDGSFEVNEISDVSESGGTLTFRFYKPWVTQPSTPANVAAIRIGEWDILFKSYSIAWDAAKPWRGVYVERTGGDGPVVMLSLSARAASGVFVWAYGAGGVSYTDMIEGSAWGAWEKYAAEYGCDIAVLTQVEMGADSQEGTDTYAHMIGRMQDAQPSCDSFLITSQPDYATPNVGGGGTEDGVAKGDGYDFDAQFADVYTSAGEVGAVYWNAVPRTKSMVGQMLACELNDVIHSNANGTYNMIEAMFDDLETLGLAQPAPQQSLSDRSRGRGRSRADMLSTRRR